MEICVFGSATDEINKNYLIEGERLGEKLAKRGHNLVFGCGSAGLMGAVARGVKKEKGKTLGIIPKFFEEKGYEAIDFNCDRIIKTQSMAERKLIMENMSDAFIITPGGIGTFEEFFEVLTLKQLGVHKKAIAILDIDNYFSKLNQTFEWAVEQKFVKENCHNLYKTFTDIDKLIEYLEKYNAETQDWALLK